MRGDNSVLWVSFVGEGKGTGANYIKESSPLKNDTN